MVAVLVVALLVVALMGTALTVLVIFSHGVFPRIRSLFKDPESNELWDNAGNRYRIGFVGVFVSTFVAGLTAGILMVTGHLWKGAVVFVLGIALAVAFSTLRFAAVRRYRETMDSVRRMSSS
jgi:hypothetical protein